MTQEFEWVLTLTLPGKSGRVLGRYATRDESMLAGQAHFAKQMGASDSDDDDELGWQMGMNGATALSPIGIYRVSRK